MCLDVLPMNPRHCTRMGVGFVTTTAPGGSGTTGRQHDHIQPGISRPRDARSRLQWQPAKHNIAHPAAGCRGHMQHHRCGAGCADATNCRCWSATTHGCHRQCCVSLCSLHNSSRYGARRFVMTDCCMVTLAEDLLGTGQTSARKGFCHDEAQGLGAAGWWDRQAACMEGSMHERWGASVWAHDSVTWMPF